MTTNDPKPRPWDVRLPDGRIQTWAVDPAKGPDYVMTGEWVDARTYSNPAALLKGELGRLEGFSNF